MLHDLAEDAGMGIARLFVHVRELLRGDGVRVQVGELLRGWMPRLLVFTDELLGDGRALFG